MRSLILLTALLAVCASAAYAQNQAGSGFSKSDENLYKKLMEEGASSAAALDQVLKRPETASSIVLYMASSVATREVYEAYQPRGKTRDETKPPPSLLTASSTPKGAKRLEDAAFLFYAAQSRARFDQAMFPPVGTGGDSPNTLLGAMSYTLGQSINPAIMARPASFKRVVARFAAWQPQTPVGYAPGWKYTPADATAARATYSDYQKKSLKIARDMSALLDDPEYFKNFRIVQQYNAQRNSLDPSGSGPAEAAYKAAVARLTAIEKEKKIAGPYTMSPDE